MRLLVSSLMVAFGLVTISNESFAQKFITSRSDITFYSYAPIEDIQATNVRGRSIINLSTGELVFSVPIKHFIFEKALMQEHFNENYMESDKHPNATFLAKIEDWEYFEGKRKVKAKGRLTIHGVTREVEVDGDLYISGNRVSVQAEFFVKVADHDITIPTAVFYNIAKEIEVDVFMEYKPYKGK